MNWPSALVAMSMAMMIGCGAELDNDPTILGLTPALRAEIREVMAESEPAADADKAVKRYMQELQGVAEGLKIKPNAAGDYVLPPQQDPTFEKLHTQGSPRDGLMVLQDFDVELPPWADPLVDEYSAGNISSVREELLKTTINAELARVIYELQR